ncbi:MAG: 7-cyano-7-deazaguanine synthase QueC [Candidatus Omnitrophica bacterium]|nr:7-cyano-7-deazaguanine synthase QueC [Candidatus Omnitrophota bacterium]MCM8793868.1 7-cyano-7-deazaguanine synthase QueC [Candidatus Omnitrophota bacterium]
MKKAVVLLSGGIDSTTTLFLAKKRGFNCFCLIFDYGQRHKREIASAKRMAKLARCPYALMSIRLPWKGSSLLDKKLKVPQRYNAITQRPNNTIPSTYVPARNTIFLSFALSYAEAISAEAIFIGANAVDFSGYPDCRANFYQAFNKIIKLGTKAGVEGKKIKIYTPLINKSKAEIIKLGMSLGVPFGLTWSCYKGGKKPCEKCASCFFRKKGFREAGVVDPLWDKEKRYAQENC